jgi:hypothetical protein
MTNLTEIIIIILITVTISAIIGLNIINIIDKRISDISINMPKIQIPETKVVLTTDNIKELCTLRSANNSKNNKLVETFDNINNNDNNIYLNINDHKNGHALKEKKNQVKYITAEQFYNRYYCNSPYNNNDDSKFIPSNYVNYLTDADVKKNIKIIDDKLVRKSTQAVKASNYVF